MIRSVLLLAVALCVEAVPLCAQATAATRTDASSYVDFLKQDRQAAARATAEETDAVRTLLASARERIVRDLESRRRAGVTGSLSSITTLPFPSIAATTTSTSQSLAVSLAGYLAGRDSLLTAPGSAAVPMSVPGLSARSTVADAHSLLDALRSRRSAEIGDGAPDAGTAAYAGLEKALIVDIADQGVDESRLTTLSDRVDALAGTADGVEAMSRYLQASGTVVGRPPSSDDLSGWRFLFAQALGQEWIVVLASASPDEFGKRMAVLSDRLTEVDSELAGALGDFASAVAANGDAVRGMADYLPELWRSLDPAALFPPASTKGSGGAGAVASTATAPQVQSRFLREASQIPVGRLTAYFAAQPLAAVAASDLRAIVDALDEPERRSYLASTGLGTSGFDAAQALISAALRRASTQRATLLGLPSVTAESVATAAGGAGAPSGPQPPQPADGGELWANAQSVVSQAQQYARAGGRQTELDWTLLSVLENRFASYLVEYTTSGADVRDAFHAYLAQLYAEADERAASLLDASAGSGSTGDTPRGTSTAGARHDLVSTSVHATEVFSDPAAGREVAFYRENRFSDGSITRAAVPVSLGWDAYIRAFYLATHASAGAEGVSTDELSLWARSHGQSVVPFGFRRLFDAIQLAEPTSAALNGAQVTNRIVPSSEAATVESFLTSVAAAWPTAPTAATTPGTPEVAGIPAGTGPRFIDRALVLFLHHISANAGDVLRRTGTRLDEISDPRMTATLATLSELSDFSRTPSDAIAALDRIWDLSGVDASVRGVTERIAAALMSDAQYHYLVAMALRLRGIESRIAAETTGGLYGNFEAALESLDASASAGFVPLDAYAAARDRILRALRVSAADRTRVAAVATALRRAGLISEAEATDLGVPGGVK